MCTGCCSTLLYFILYVLFLKLALLAATDFIAVVEQKLAHDEFAALHPGDEEAATRAFVSFNGMFGQVYNTTVSGFSVAKV